MTDPIALHLAIREAVHADILECVEDYLAARQHRTIAEHVGPLVEHIIAEAFSKPADDCDLKPREAYLDPEAEAEEDGLCPSCGRGEDIDHLACALRVADHTPPCKACPELGLTACKALAEEVDESICGECGRGDYDHTLGCRAGREQDSGDAFRYAAGIDDADAFCARHCRGRGRQGHHLLCHLGALEDQENLDRAERRLAEEADDGDDLCGESVVAEVNAAVLANARAGAADELCRECGWYGGIHWLRCTHHPDIVVVLGKIRADDMRLRVCDECGRGDREHWKSCRWHHSKRGKHDPEMVEAEEDGLCSDCGHSVLAHHPRCEILLADEVDESICGECGRGDYDHTFSCSVGREQDRSEALRYAVLGRRVGKGEADAKIDALAEDLDVAERQSAFRRPRLWTGVDLPEAPSELAETIPHITAEMIGREWTGQASIRPQEFLCHLAEEPNHVLDAGLAAAKATAQTVQLMGGAPKAGPEELAAQRRGKSPFTDLGKIGRERFAFVNGVLYIGPEEMGQPIEEPSESEDDQ